MARATSLAIVLSSMLFGGCATSPPPEPLAAPAPMAEPARFDEAAAALDAGIGLYEGGRYDAATVELRRALELGLKTPAEAVHARKHLAFILCAGGNLPECRDEFRAAFAIDPRFTLGKAEAGHPMWGPAFIEVRKEFAAGAR